MVKTDIWMPLFIGDYLADTSRLTTEQHGAYFLLIMDYWRSGPPPDDDLILSNITKKFKAVVMNFFSLNNGHWIHSRIDRELLNASKKKVKAKEKAENAAEARWGRLRPDQNTSDASGNATSIPQALHEVCPLPLPSPLLKTIKSKAVALASRLPPDWMPDTDGIAFCKTERPDLDDKSLVDSFRDYWIAQPGVKGRKTDWQATWRNWVRNERIKPLPGKSNTQWWSSDSGIAEKSAELNMPALPGESMQTYKERIQTALENGGKSTQHRPKAVVQIQTSSVKKSKPENFPALVSFVKSRELQ